MGPQATFPRSGIDALTKDSRAQGYWIERVVAFVIDYVLVWVVILILAFLLFLPMLFAAPFSIGFFAGLGALGALSGVLLVLYFTLADSIYGRTLGKSVFRLRVVSDSGGPPSLWQSFLRNVSKIYWLLVLLDAIVGLAVEPDYKKKFSDRFAKTSVLKS